MLLSPEGKAERRKGWVEGDKPGQPDVLFQGAVKYWKDHLTLQRCEICAHPSQLPFIFFLIIWISVVVLFLDLFFPL